MLRDAWRLAQRDPMSPVLTDNEDLVRQEAERMAQHLLGLYAKANQDREADLVQTLIDDLGENGIDITSVEV